MAGGARAVVVGASLGGLRSAEALRAAGFAGPVTVVGAERWLPYNRPPLSKQALAEGADHATLEFRRRASVADVEWRLGEEAVAADLAGRTLDLAGGDRLEWDGLVVATGLRPRRLPVEGPPPSAASRRFVLRTLDDALALREVLRPDTRVVVVGAGFVGCEVAATARSVSCHVTVVGMHAEPMLRPLGPVVAGAVRRRLEERGLEFRLGATVERLLSGGATDGPGGAPDGSVGAAGGPAAAAEGAAAEGAAAPVTGVALAGGEVLPADVVVEAVGSVCNVEWLAGNGLDLSDGVLVDGALRALHLDGTAVDGVHAVGDVARFPNAGFGGVPRRVEHWSLPTDTGRRAGALLAGHLAGSGYPEGAATGFACVPSFWSDLFDHRLQAFGMPGLGERVEVLEGALDGPFVAGYHVQGTLVGVVALDMTQAAMAYRSRVGLPPAA